MSTHHNVIHTRDSGRIVERAKKHLNTNLQWLSPPSSLNSSGGRDFGRSIESALTEIAQGSVKRIQLRKRDTAVVMSVEHYAEILLMKEMYSELIERVQQQEIAKAGDEFEHLYHKITSAESKQAADDLFSATEQSLSASYTPGTTETK